LHFLCDPWWRTHSRVPCSHSCEHRKRTNSVHMSVNAARMSACATVLAVLLAAQEPPPIARVPVRLVIAPTSVTDARGKFINGLTASDFTLYDNEVPQQIHEDADFLPISLAVAIQNNNALEGVLPQLHQLGPLLGTLVVGDGGEAAILTFNQKVELIQDFTGDLGRLSNALKHLDTAYSKSHLIDATLQSIRLLKSRPTERRRILLLISETRDQGSESKLRDAVAEAEVNNILIYSMNISRMHAAGQIFPGGLSLDIMALIKEIYGGIKTAVVENPLSVLTRYTGGRQYAFLKQHAFEDAITKIGEEIHGQYLLGYTPSNIQEQGYHKIRVELNRSEYTVRSRPGYYSMDY
jgi:VWFA-related protein